MSDQQQQGQGQEDYVDKGTCCAHHPSSLQSLSVLVICGHVGLGVCTLTATLFCGLIGLDAVEKKEGVPENRGVNEKVTDTAREGFESATG